MTNLTLPTNPKNFIAVAGIGGGGCNAVSHMHAQDIVGVDFFALNTDAQALELSPIENKILLGPRLTAGRGSGSIPGTGRKAALESSEQIRETLRNYDMVFICAGMGGGTGTGASPVIAEIAHELGILTVALVTIPFTFEGTHRHQQGLEGINGLKMCVDSIIIIPNDKLLKEHGRLTMGEAFGKSDHLFYETTKGIAEIVTIAGYINVDFHDIKTIFQNGGTAFTGHATSSGEKRAELGVQRVLLSPTMEGVNLKKVRRVLLSVSSG